ncbi:hypothetical protein L596_010351 [Steinernema carpocapsae]|uniref:Uncharacterized protein n=1 Tax=Steinernema carpocapsae TaxID=34508 RepID=A0A4U5PIJ4_STECR|nr:hypothetical protein L596_010351 [Steinernema carpocapsae]
MRISPIVRKSVAGNGEKRSEESFGVATGEASERGRGEPVLVAAAATPSPPVRWSWRRAKEKRGVLERGAERLRRVLAETIFYAITTKRYRWEEEQEDNVYRLAEYKNRREKNGRVPYGNWGAGSGDQRQRICVLVDMETGLVFGVGGRSQSWRLGEGLEKVSS